MGKDKVNKEKDKGKTLKLKWSIDEENNLILISKDEFKKLISFPDYAIIDMVKQMYYDLI